MMMTFRNTLTRTLSPEGRGTRTYGVGIFWGILSAIFALLIGQQALAQAPIIITSTASNGTVNSFIARGFVDPNGLTTFTGFNYGIVQTNLNMFTGWTSQGNGTTTNLFFNTLTGLLDGQRYWFQAVASNSAD